MGGVVGEMSAEVVFCYTKQQWSHDVLVVTNVVNDHVVVVLVLTWS